MFQMRPSACNGYPRTLRAAPPQRGNNARSQRYLSFYESLMSSPDPRASRQPRPSRPMPSGHINEQAQPVEPAERF
jgi:hypothetical protein